MPVVGDLLDEDDENYTIALSSPVNATFGDNLGFGTITDNDAEPTVSVGDVSVTEGNSGTVDATFNVTLSAPSGRAASVFYETGEDTASGTLDFHDEAFFLDFAAGETSKTVTVQVIGDVLDEANETFFLRLLDPTNATLGDAEGVGTINDDDAEPTLSVGDVTVTEGNAGTTAATFTVGLSAVSGRDVSVAYATANDSAVAPARLRGGGRDAHLRGRRHLEDGHGQRQRRRLGRGERELLPQPDGPLARDPRRRPGRRDDHGRRSGAGTLDRRRHPARGRPECDLHGHPERRPAARP